MLIKQAIPVYKKHIPISNNPKAPILYLNERGEEEKVIQTIVWMVSNKGKKWNERMGMHSPP